MFLSVHCCSESYHRLGVERVRRAGARVFFAWCMVTVSACSSTMPSAQLQSRVDLPIPASAEVTPDPERLFRPENGEHILLTPLVVTHMAFDQQPDIKSSFQRFKSEEARYDFFFVSRDSLTPRMRVSNTFDEFRDTNEDTEPARSVARHREHAVELSVEKQFFDTTELDLGLGYETVEDDDDIGNRPYVSANLRYPLWASRRKLERASEDIFRQNELNDTQLAYIQEVRSRLQNALFRFHDVAHLSRRVEFHEQWAADLQRLADLMDELQGRDLTTDRGRLDAEIARVNADLRIAAGWYDIQLARLKAAIGMSFSTKVTLSEEPFNPFEGMTHAEVLRASIETDPEIATLKNAMENADVQLDLARRGTWDVALLLNASSALEGRGSDEGDSDWSVSAGVDVSAVDRRVTDSLTRQARANIHRFSQAIAARENAIFVDTLEPMVRLDTIGESREELMGNLSRYVRDFETGITTYRAGQLNIDDLLSRRQTVFGQEDAISNLTFLIGANVAELCAATGKFFEFLNGKPGEGPPAQFPSDPVGS